MAEAVDKAHRKYLAEVETIKAKHKERVLKETATSEKKTSSRVYQMT